MTNVVYFLAQAAGNPNALLTTILLPFLLIFVILWGVLNVMKIFGREETGRKINLILALVITIFAAFTDAWGIVATQLAAFTGIFTYVMFFAVFIIGTVLWAIGRTKTIYHSQMGDHMGKMNNLKKLDKEIGKRMTKHEELVYAGKDGEAAAIMETIIELKKRRNFLIEQATSHRH